VSEEQKQKIKDTILELVKICRQKELYCIHDNVDDLIESALNSKLISINLNSQCLDKEQQEVKNVVEQPAEHGNRIESLQNFRVIHKSSISFKNTSQISPVHAVAPILSTEEPEHSLSMGLLKKMRLSVICPLKMILLHLSLLFQILFSKIMKILILDDESLPEEDASAEEFKVYSNPLFDEDEINSDKFDPHCFNVESNFVESLLNHDTFIDSSSKFDLSGELAHVNLEISESNFDFEEEIRLIENLLYDNSSPRSPEELNAEIADTIVESIPSLSIPVQDGDSQREEIDIVTEDDVLPPSVENDDDSTNDPLLEEADLFLFDNSIPSGIENSADDPEGDIRFLEELLIDDSILSNESSDSNFKDNPSILRPPPEPPDAEFDFEPDAEKKIPVVMNEKDEFDVSSDENDDYFPFMFVIRIFLPYLFCDKMFISFLSAESEDTIFDPGISV
nr:hypothetical protein [Tanacetum cinerariifolium]